MELITGIRIFVLAAQYGSLAAAGRHIGVSTATISRQIAAVEAQLKVRLFNRGKRALTLTEAGELLMRRARPLLDGLDETVESLSLLEARPQGLLRVSVRGNPACARLIPALPRFLDQNPDVQIDLLVSNDENADLIANNIDVDIRYTRPDSTDLIAKLLAPSRLVLVAAPSYAAVHGVPESVEALRNHQAIRFDPVEMNASWEFRDADGVIKAIAPGGRVRVNDGTVLRSAILAGLGIGMMPLQEVEDDIASGLLVAVLPHVQVVRPIPGGEGIFAVYHKVPYQTGKLRSFLAFLPDVFA